MEVQILGLLGEQAFRIELARIGGLAWYVEGLPAGCWRSQLRRVRTAVATCGLPLPFGGTRILVRPALASGAGGLDLPIALGLMALATEESLGCGVFASGQLRIDGRTVASGPGAPCVGYMNPEAGGLRPSVVLPAGDLGEARCLVRLLWRPAR